MKFEFTWKVRYVSEEPDKTSSTTMDDFTEPLEASVPNIKQGERGDPKGLLLKDG